MIRALYEGFRQYNSSGEGFDYFYLHLILESDHVAWISNAAKIYEKEGHGEEVFAGGVKVAELLQNFWAGLYEVAINDGAYGDRQAIRQA